MKTNHDEFGIVIAGLGNCATALIRSLEAAKKGQLKGVRRTSLAGISCSQIKVVAAFDVNTKKIGKDISEAIEENTTENICEVPFMGVSVSRGPILDGVAPHMKDVFCPDYSIDVTMEEAVNIVKKANGRIVVNYMPVGSEEASIFYALVALEAGCGFINCMPSIIPKWIIEEFERRGLPFIGSDIKSEFGASIFNRTLLHLMDLRGAVIERSEQHNEGENTDFQNMEFDPEDPSRMSTKWHSKRGTVLSNVRQEIDFELICNGINPDLLPDHKRAEFLVTATVCNTEMCFKAYMDVVDSYNSAGVVLEAILICVMALKRGIAGPIKAACAFFMKSPVSGQMEDNEAARQLEELINDNARSILVGHTRDKKRAGPGEQYSIYWSGIYDQFCNLPGMQVWSPKKYYHSEKEFFELVKDAVKTLAECADGYERNLVMPFSITNSGLRRQLIAFLKEYPEINIFGINVPPTEEYTSQLPNICGYAGMDEIEVGRELFRELVSRAKISKILIVHHEKNNGLVMRSDGIKELAAKAGIQVVEHMTYKHRQIKAILTEDGIGVITLGCRGTKTILKMGIPVPLVCMDIDCDPTGKEKILVGFSQKNLYEGIIFSGDLRKVFKPQKIETGQRREAL